MAGRVVRAALVAHVMALLLAASGGEEGTTTNLSRVRQPRYWFDIPKDDVFYDTRVIPLDHQVAAFLYKGDTKRFFFLQEKKDSCASITVTPCTSSVVWSVRYRHQNDTDKLSDLTAVNSSSGPPLYEYRGRELHTFSLERAAVGMYVLQVTPLEAESYVHLYASQEPGGPPPLRMLHKPRLRLQKKQRRKRLTVRWEPSSVDPHVMHYCLVVNTRRYYSTLCEAQGEKYGVAPPEVSLMSGFNFPREQAEAHKNELANKASRLGRGSGEIHEDIVVECVRGKTHHTLYNLEHGKVYHFNLFAVNRRTNLSFSYGNTTLKYEHRNKPTSLKDGKVTSVNFRKLNGRAIFKFKVGRHAASGLQLYVMPCGGGAVNVELTLRGVAVVTKRRVEGYERFNVNNSAKGERYVLRVTAVNQDELRRIQAIEVLATTREQEQFPLPSLPAETRLHEYPGLARCDSVTVGWVAAPDPLTTKYCVSLTEDLWGDSETARTPNQCGLDTKGRQRTPNRVEICMDKPLSNTSSVITQTIHRLKHGQRYVAQVTVKKSKGRTLSYDLLQVRTKSSCSSRGRVLLGEQTVSRRTP